MKSSLSLLVNVLSTMLLFGLYYICIFGNTAATYKLTVSNEAHDLYLHPGLSESGYIDPNETHLYYFSDPIFVSADA